MDERDNRNEAGEEHTGVAGVVSAAKRSIRSARRAYSSAVFFTPPIVAAIGTIAIVVCDICDTNHYH